MDIASCVRKHKSVEAIMKNKIFSNIHVLNLILKMPW
jgi:stress-induced morphogen